MNHLNHFDMLGENCSQLKTPLCSITKDEKTDSEIIKDLRKNQAEMKSIFLELMQPCESHNLFECPTLYEEIESYCISYFSFLKVNY